MSDNRPWFYGLFQGYVWQPTLILFFVSGICLTTDLDFMFCFRDMSDNRPWFYALFQGYVWQPTLILCFVSGICLTTDLDLCFVSRIYLTTILILCFVLGICLTTHLDCMLCFRDMSENDIDFMFCFMDMSDNGPGFYVLFQGYVWQPTLILCFVSGICLTTDLDFMFHMNNGRYPRECDFGRFKFWLQSNTWQTIKKLGGSMSNTGNNIRYRRSLELFDIYKIKTKV